ncbi:MAG: hypothetical protein Q9217_005429 [Psora testacea]
MVAMKRTLRKQQICKVEDLEAADSTLEQNANVGQEDQKRDAASEKAKHEMSTGMTRGKQPPLRMKMTTVTTTSQSTPNMPALTAYGPVTGRASPPKPPIPNSVSVVFVTTYCASDHPHVRVFPMIDGPKDLTNALV